MIRFFRRLLIALLLLLLSFGGITGLLLGSSAGLNCLLRQPALLALVPGDLSIERVEGGLFGELRLFGLRYQDPSERLEIDQLFLQWRPEALWQGLLQITALEMGAVRYQVLIADDAPIPEPPDLRPPLVIALEQARIRDLTLITAPGDPPLRLQQLLFEARWNADRIQLQRLSVAGPDFALQMNGQLRPKGAYPLALEMILEYRSEELPQMALRGRLSGELQRLQVALVAEGAYQAKLEGSIEQILDQPRWLARLDIDRLPVELIGEQLPADLQWQLQGSGDLEQAAARIEVRAAAGTSANMTASLHFDTLGLDASGDWQQLQWPLTGPALLRSRRGHFTLTGDPDDYRFELQGGLTGTEIPPGTWSLAGHGGQRQLVLTRIEGETLGGRVRADASVAWEPALEWRLKLDATGLDPSGYWPEWPGQLELRLAAKGGEQQGRPQITMAVERLKGQLRGFPLRAQGQFVMDGSGMRFDQVELHSGSAWLQANGALTPDWDLEWAFEVPDLAELLPGGEGQMQGKGRLQGEAKIPLIQGSLEAKAIVWRQMSLRQLSADLSLDPAAGEDSRIVLEVEGLVAAGQQADTASLVLFGPLEHQLIRIGVDHARDRLQLEAVGSFQPERKQWQGEISQLDLKQRKFGRWKLQQPVALSIAPGTLTLAPLCLRQREAALCTEAVWVPSSGSASVTLRDFSLERLKPLLPAAISQLGGAMGADLKIELGAMPTASLQVDLEPGEISYQVDAGHLVHLQHRGGLIEAVLGRERLTAHWDLAVGDSGASGALDIPRRQLEQTPEQAPLAGSARFQIKQLGLLSALVPELQETQGEVEGRLTLEGVVGAPVVKGNIDLNMVRVELPRTGITLREIKLRLSGDGSERLRISGGLSSGPGRVEITGYLSLARQRGWPAAVSITGERFQVVDLPDTQVLVSPEIQLEHDSKGLKVTGTLELPSVRMVLDWIPSSARKLSSDVIIVTAKKTAETAADTLPVQARVTVILGKNVHFRGFGLNADLDGRVTISSEPGRLLVANGELGIVGGSFRLGQELDIERGRIHYAGGSLDNPGLDIKAGREVGDIRVGVRVTGTARKPRFIGFSSDPNLTEEDALSLLLTGQTKGAGSVSDTRAYIGTNLTDRFSVGTRTSMDTDQKEFVGRYRLSRRWGIETTTGADKSGAEVVYTIELE